MARNKRSRDRRETRTTPPPATMQRGHAFTASRARKYAQATIPELQRETTAGALSNGMETPLGTAARGVPTARAAQVGVPVQANAKTGTATKTNPGQTIAQNTCKGRPNNNTRSGKGSRAFVPWCK